MNASTSADRLDADPSVQRRCGCGRPACREEFGALAARRGPRRAALRDRLVEVHLDLAYAVAARYGRSGPGAEDLRQVAALALVEAVHRFDVGLGPAFSAFAVPTIAGALKRHFRDQLWMLHPPRRVKELRLRIRGVHDLLTQELRRSPTVSDLAEHLQCSAEEICEALSTEEVLRPLSLDAPAHTGDDDGEDASLVDTLGGPDPAYSRIEVVETLRPLLAELSERERRVLAMRFAGGLTQSQIAERIGYSQVHVSRILRSALDRLRHGLQRGPRWADDAPGTGDTAESGASRAAYEVADEVADEVDRHESGTARAGTPRAPEPRRHRWRLPRQLPAEPTASWGGWEPHASVTGMPRSPPRTASWAEGSDLGLAVVDVDQHLAHGPVLHRRLGVGGPVEGEMVQREAAGLADADRAVVHRT
jgi:RNA polymerase sigma-B factor